MADREDNVYIAKLAEQAERHDEMVEAMKKVASLNVELTAEERNLLSVAYENTIEARRIASIMISRVEEKEEHKLAAIMIRSIKEKKKKKQASSRMISSIEVEEESIESDNTLVMAKQYRMQVEKELKDICQDVLDVLDKHLIPSASTAESIVFYYKMKGDYNRYLAEFATDNDKDEAAENSLEAYKTGIDIAMTKLPPTHPIRLGLALNFAVFHFEILSSPDRAYHLAKPAFDDAMAELDNLSEESYEESSYVMQLLRDNMTVWMHYMQYDDDKQQNINSFSSIFKLFRFTKSSSK